MKTRNKMKKMKMNGKIMKKKKKKKMMMKKKRKMKM
jgi:hypothetical protein